MGIQKWWRVRRMMFVHLMVLTLPWDIWNFWTCTMSWKRFDFCLSFLGNIHEVFPRFWNFIYEWSATKVTLHPSVNKHLYLDVYHCISSIRWLSKFSYFEGQFEKFKKPFHSLKTLQKNIVAICHSIKSLKPDSFKHWSASVVENMLSTTFDRCVLTWQA